MRLALRLGRTIPELLHSMSSAEITEWRAFDQIEPIGDSRMDLGFGIVAATFANAHLKEGATPLSPIDFMPYAQKPKKASWAEKLKQLLKANSSAKKKE